MCMERLTLASIDSVNDNDRREIKLTFKSIYTNLTYIFIVDKIRHRLNEVVSLEFLQEIYINTPKYNENTRTTKKI